MKNLPDICEWTYEDLNELTNSETDIFEYKSSKVSLDELKNKISIAASAFWNSGGGIFIAGVDDNGAVDGGIPCCKGRQDIRDWVDTAIKQTEPLGEYEIHLIGHDGNAGYIEEGKVILFHIWLMTRNIILGPVLIRLEPIIFKLKHCGH